MIILAVVFAVALVWANWPLRPLPDGATADRVVLAKGSRTLTLYQGTQVLRCYRVALGRTPQGAKRQEGDGRTPEGHYTLDYQKPDSAYHRALHISYPSDADRDAAVARGVKPGGFVMVHGLPRRFGWIGRLHRLADWTDGCVAVSNAEIRQIWDAVPVGTPIELLP